MNALDEPDTGLSILKSFVSLKGTKRQLTVQEVIDSSRAFGKDIPSDKVSNLLLKFVNFRILRDKDENGKYELRHDSLATKIYEKITLVEKELMEVNQFLENAHINWQKRGIYLSLEDLNYIMLYESRLYLSEELSDLIGKSKNEIKKTKRRKRNLIAVSVIALMVIFAGFTVWALNEKRKARLQENLAIESMNKAKESEGRALNAKTIAEKELYENIINTWTITADRMNVLYIGIDNPVKITASGIMSDKIFAEAHNGIITRKGDDFSIRPLTSDQCIIKVWGISNSGDTVNLGHRSFRTKTFPLPSVIVKGQNFDGTIDRDLLLQAKTVDQVYDKVDFDIDTSICKIKIFSVLFSDRIGDFMSRSFSNRFTLEQKSLLRRVRHGQKLIMMDIIGTDVSGNTIDLPPVILTILDQNEYNIRQSLQNEYISKIKLKKFDAPDLFKVRSEILNKNDNQLIGAIIDSLDAFRWEKLFNNYEDPDVIMIQKELILFKKVEDSMQEKTLNRALSLSFDYQLLSNVFFENNNLDSALHYINVSLSLNSNKTAKHTAAIYDFTKRSKIMPNDLKMYTISNNNQDNIYNKVFEESFRITYDSLMEKPSALGSLSRDYLEFVNDYAYRQSLPLNVVKGGTIISLLADTSNLMALIDMYIFNPNDYLYEKIDKMLQNYMDEPEREKINIQYFLQHIHLVNINIDHPRLKIALPQFQIEISKKLVEMPDQDPAILNQISSTCSDLSYTLIEGNNYEFALEAAKTAIKANSNNYYSYTNLVLAYIFNNMYKDAEKEYLKWRDIRWIDPARSFKDIFLEDIADLESRGITHPDFVKVKKLLTD